MRRLFLSYQFAKLPVHRLEEAFYRWSSEIDAERRSGYAWYTEWGEEVAAMYQKWKKRWLEE